MLVSGCSDAVNALSMGYQPVWLDSETKGLAEKDYQLLLKYARRVINIPDIDDTGIKAGVRLALSIPPIYTAWMSEGDMYGLHDNRGRRRKDLKDYLHLHPDAKAMQQLIGRAKCAKFWTYKRLKRDRKNIASRAARSTISWNSMASSPSRMTITRNLRMYISTVLE